VRDRSIEVDSLGVNPFDFGIDAETVERLFESGRSAASAFLASRAARP
jgi:hypothetical protein